MQITPKERAESNRDYALRIIRENIVNMEIKPGTMIGEQEIATQLGCSRTPVHEAFLELSKSRILDVLPQKGCRVAMIDYHLINEARFLRKTVETALAEEACDVATPKDIEELEVNINLQRFYAGTDTAKLLELDNDFHKTIYRICNKMQIHYMVSLMSIHFDRVRKLSLESVKDSKILSDHVAILEAIKEKDKEKARNAVARHMERFDMDWSIIKEVFSEYISTEETT
ncbi:MAG: GntR family transcriptional regulator [Clostridiales bacterium]|nr:GntR family transcriptional regulator [Clostridiales bacterium]